MSCTATVAPRLDSERAARLVGIGDEDRAGAPRACATMMATRPIASAPVTTSVSSAAKRKPCVITPAPISSSQPNPARISSGAPTGSLVIARVCAAERVRRERRLAEEEAVDLDRLRAAAARPARSSIEERAPSHRACARQGSARRNPRRRADCRPRSGAQAPQDAGADDHRASPGLNMGDGSRRSSRRCRRPRSRARRAGASAASPEIALRSARATPQATRRTSTSSARGSSSSRALDLERCAMARAGDGGFDFHVATFPVFSEPNNLIGSRSFAKRPVVRDTGRGPNETSTNRAKGPWVAASFVPDDAVATSRASRM